MTHPQQEIVALLPEMRGFARSLAGGDPHLADDLVQDAIVLALRAWDSFEPGTNLKSWLLKILHNRFHSLKRRSYLKAEVASDNLENLSWSPPSQEQNAELRTFKRAFAALKPAHRTALVLVGVHGLPYEEVAKVCGCEVGTVKSRVNRARAVLKGMLLDSQATPARPAPAKPSRWRAKLPAAAAPMTAPAPKPPTPILVAAPLLPDLRMLAEADRLIVAAETRLASCQRIAGCLDRIRVNSDAGRMMLHLAERHLAGLYACRDRLLAAARAPMAALDPAQRPPAALKSQ
jgi:RNA polymerase sigma-70 factor (ECF subfamily)